MSESNGNEQAIDTDGLFTKTSEIVAAFVGNNHVRPEDLGSLINTVKNALQSNFKNGVALTVSPPSSQKDNWEDRRDDRRVENLPSNVPVASSYERTTDAPAVPVKKSITSDFIICLEDGRPFKSLKRHLRTSFNMSPEQYRAKWGLPFDYPMVAPNYASQRSKMARDSGLGRRMEPGIATNNTARGTLHRASSR